MMAMLTKNVVMNGPSEYTKRFTNFQCDFSPGEPNEPKSHAPISWCCRGIEIMEHMDTRIYESYVRIVIIDGKID